MSTLMAASDLSLCASRTETLTLRIRFETFCTVPVMASLRSPCPRVSGEDDVRTAGDLAAYSLRQEAALAVCEARRDAILSAVDAHNAAVSGLRGGAAGAHSR